MRAGQKIRKTSVRVTGIGASPGQRGKSGVKRGVLPIRPADKLTPTKIVVRIEFKYMYSGQPIQQRCRSAEQYNFVIRTFILPGSQSSSWHPTLLEGNVLGAYKSLGDECKWNICS